ncbi:MAG: hypothetical protein WAV47_14100 [Blastocatellia bacterium]
MNEPFNEGFIVRYLLGDLSEQEQVEVEDRAFSDADYLQSILAVEADLIDEYVRGGLYQNERRKFEARFLVSSERRQKVEFARALARVTGESIATETVPRPVSIVTPARWWDAFLASLRGASPAVRFSLAAASLVVVIGIALLIVQTIRLRGELAQLQAEQHERQQNQQTLEQQFADELARNQELAAGFQREQQQRERNEELIRELERGRAESENKPSQPTVLSFVLLPGVSRSGGALPKLAVPRAARLVRLQIGIEPGDEYKSFSVELLTQGGQHIWSQNSLSARSTRTGRALVLNLPARLLGAGRYELALKGMTDAGKTEDVGYYYFDVLKK